MEIVIMFDRMQFVRDYMRELSERYQDKIKNYNRAQNRMILTNGDIIKGHTDSQRNIDGLRADAIIGRDDYRITCQSKLDNPIWADEDLKRHIEMIT